ncbi:unnamed protein product [Dibothriocephalus latus]|uniref:Reverse transcriptase domain-containing protein n=1 Tax=Dibothriocephalus latus TaxID=60516 RepID=A0A3P7NAH7_DIBLA|nr:unnamed protein product [Dibothriocephalus latus]
MRVGQQSNCLDLVRTKSHDSINEVSCLPPLGKSDHVVLLLAYSLFSITEKPSTARRNIWRGDFDQMMAELTRTEWESLFFGKITTDWETFRDTLHRLIEKQFNFAKKVDHQTAMAYTGLKNRSEQKRKLWKKHLRTGLLHLSACKPQRNRVKGLILKTSRDFEADLLNPAIVISKLSYSYLRQRTKNRDPIPLLTTAEGRDLIEDEAKADHLSEFFRSVYTKETAYDYLTDGTDVDAIVETVQITRGC